MKPKKMTQKDVEKALKNPHKADWSKLDKNDIRVGLGPAMTEEQMMEYCKQNGIASPQIIGRNTSS